MARVLKTVSSSMVLAVLVIHAVLLPLLFYGLTRVLEEGNRNAFLDHTRIYVRTFADLLEATGEIRQDEALVADLDSAVLGGTTVFASLQTQDRLIISSLMTSDDAEEFVEDFAFGQHDDNVYFLSVPIEISGVAANLRMGFDESPTLGQIANTRRTVIYILAAYLGVSLILVILLGKIVTRPLKKLRRDSRMIVSGDHVRQLTVDSDILEFRELTADLETMRSTLVGMNARLQKEITEREAAVAEQHSLEERLRHSQRLESIGTLAGGIAHEYNNVLLPLLLFADLSLEDLPEGHPVRPNLRRVQKLANRAKNLSQKILTFGRHSSEKTRVALDIAPVVEEAMSMVRALIPANIDIRVEIEHNTGMVLCDATEIQQLVVNLCSNAQKSLSSGGGLMMVRVTQCQVDEIFADQHMSLRVGEYVRLEISDNGQGIDPVAMERIFEPFFTTQEVGEGTGLGLAVVHGIVSRHDGEIVVSSEPNKITTFDVYFPKAGKQAIPEEEAEI
jgi:signal transduction histidine kinase